MLSRLQFLVEGFFEWSAGVFKKAGLSPNSITFLSFILAVITSALYAAGLSPMVLWFAAVVSLVLSGYFDALDGAMARRFRLVTQTGGVLDSILDRIGEISIYSGLAVGGLVDFRLALWALSAALMVSYVRARAEIEGVTMKGVGIAERPERLLVLLVATILAPISKNDALGWGMGLIAVLASATVLERVYVVTRRLSG
ncbi:CDP-alcohol phosphatidyltransferase family protein [Candidatus Bathyarchaeota archaeon]|nr:MAG: CDP-alcohol phosphatidyltransferase family protein [Candidatus Bathyarchaeota archaeon]TMI30522.1 MAG: CDP-alcohol phosphatidyltransferase family protein [Candidatus Bathyarchaeota archaeon]